LGHPDINSLGFILKSFGSLWIGIVTLKRKKNAKKTSPVNFKIFSLVRF
jgi:hypothetical protein